MEWLEHGLKMLTVAELIRYRMQHERYVHRVGEALVDTEYGEFRVIAYDSEVDGGESHLALVKGDIDVVASPRRLQLLGELGAGCIAIRVLGVGRERGDQENAK